MVGRRHLYPVGIDVVIALQAGQRRGSGNGHAW